MMSIRLMVAGGALGVGTVLAALLMTGVPIPEKAQTASRPIPPDVRALVAAMPAEAPDADLAAAEREALAVAVLAALGRVEQAEAAAAEPAAAEPVAALRAVTPADAPAFRLDAGAEWVAASGLVDPATELRPLPRRN